MAQMNVLEMVDFYMAHGMSEEDACKMTDIENGGDWRDQFEIDQDKAKEEYERFMREIAEEYEEA